MGSNSLNYTRALLDEDARGRHHEFIIVIEDKGPIWLKKDTGYPELWNQLGMDQKLADRHQGEFREHKGS
ncbi:hypothetical protein CMV_022010 [Castanea mollissima]|uniref:Uncharacterized protein n=1 Tax=Castanea mollissima TaxID=60419 RepID=A0A8J4QN01_9ROSI|nr:hypothetical protein CMV_022010 [Castanea mollissima]